MAMNISLLLHTSQTLSDAASDSCMATTRLFARWYPPVPLVNSLTIQEIPAPNTLNVSSACPKSPNVIMHQETALAGTKKEIQKIKVQQKASFSEAREIATAERASLDFTNKPSYASSVIPPVMPAMKPPLITSSKFSTSTRSIAVQTDIQNCTLSPVTLIDTSPGFIPPANIPPEWPVLLEPPHL